MSVLQPLEGGTRWNFHCTQEQHFANLPVDKWRLPTRKFMLGKENYESDSSSTTEPVCLITSRGHSSYEGIQKEKFLAYTRKSSGCVVEMCFRPDRMNTRYRVQAGMPCALAGSTDRSVLFLPSQHRTLGAGQHCRTPTPCTPSAQTRAEHYTGCPPRRHSKNKGFLTLSTQK